MARHPSSVPPLLAITMGDPAGIGPEVIAKALSIRAVRRLCRPVVIASIPVMHATLRALGLRQRAVPVSGHGEEFGADEIPVLDPLERPLGAIRMGTVSKHTGAAAVTCVLKAVRLAQAGCVSGIVTGPLNKEAINVAGYAYPGHTELLAAVTKSRDVGMMIVGGPLKVMFVTTHVSIRALPDAITVSGVMRAIRLADRAMREWYGHGKPRVGVAALNPHGGEHGLFGEEERRTILPAVRRARQAGIDASDPLPADTLFGQASRGEFDAVVAMYHDQGLIALKTLAFGACVNVTVGLPLIRTSVDHGTAFDIAGRGVAAPDSLIQAITLAARLAASTRGTHEQSGQTVDRPRDPATRRA